MKAAWYETQGVAHDVLTVGRMDDPRPQAGEVRIRETNLAILAQGGSIATYAANQFTPRIPFWPLIFSNVRLFFVGSDDVPAEAKVEAAQAVNQALAAGWSGLAIAARFVLDDIARAHEFVERPTKPGRVIVAV